MKIIKMADASNPTSDIKDPKVLGLFKRVVDSNRMTWKMDRDWITIPSANYTSAQRTYVGIISTGNAITKVVPTYKVIITLSSVSKDYSTYDAGHVYLYFNKMGSPTFDGSVEIAHWMFSKEDDIKGNLNDFLSTQLGFSMTKMPHDLVQEKAKMAEGKISRSVRLTRRKIRGRGIFATELIIKIDPKPSNKIGHVVSYIATNLETMEKNPPVVLKERKNDGTELMASDALEIFNKFVTSAKDNGYVSEDTKYEYIPENANPANFNFEFNTPKMSELPSQKPLRTSLPSDGIDDDDDIQASNKKQYRLADFEGFFTGNVPDYATQFLGTTSVEASQIAAMFGKANEAITLVNQFDSSLLYNISFIFNFAKSGAYGVYLSELDRAIKTKALQKKLEQKGYKVVVTEKGLTAYPKEGSDIAPDAIQQDIDSIYADLQSKGGTAIGINMNAVLNAARQDAMESGSKDPEVWQWIAVLHLGGTIVHEAIHAKGNMDEGPSEQAEQAFSQWALPKINEAYKNSLVGQGKGEEFNPLTITGRQRHAKSGTWYKTAQMSYYVPHSFTERPLGSDLHGRFPNGPSNEMEMQDWTMMAQQDQGIPIEKKLGRQYMSPIPNDLSQEHDILEEQLRKYTRDGWKLDPKANMEELLSSGWDVDRGYTTLEGLLDEKRPKPLMIPLNKKASKTILASSIKWVKVDPDDPFYKSVDGRFEIEPKYQHGVRPAGFSVRDHKMNKTYNAFNLVDAKDIANKILSKESENPEEVAKKKAIIKAKERFSQAYAQERGWDINNLTADQINEILKQEGFINPVIASSDKLTKTATLFGWMNNLSISDGSTIPGLGDRVMAWEDRDECFSEEEQWIKQQPRYNPTYDIKGFFYRWIEPRYQPQLFDDMTRDYSNTHPAKRFASSVQIDPETAHILSVLSKAKSRISQGQILTTRFIATEDVMPLIDRLFPDNAFKINVFHYGETDNQGDIYAVWVSAPKVDENNIERAEKYLQGKSIEKDVDSLIDNLTGISKQKEVVLHEIIDIVKDVCSSYGFSNLSIVGSYPRDIAMKSPLYMIDSLEFRGGDSDQCLKIGSLVAEKLGSKGVDISHHNLSFVYKNVMVSFTGDAIPIEVKAGLQDQGIATDSEYVDLFNRDFTVNMLIYDLANNKITDPTGKASEDIQNKTLKTFLDPDYVCKQNPIIILRALKLKIRHNMSIDPLLSKAMGDNKNLLFDGRYSERDLIIARENVRKEGKKEAQELFAKFGLEILDKI